VILTGKTSKTEFVCKNYARSKFAVENCPIRTKIDLTSGNRVKPDWDADLTFFSDIFFFAIFFFLLFYSQPEGGDYLDTTMDTIMVVRVYGSVW
jgi:hypothetical protein